jgi:hypothetical protein
MKIAVVLALIALASALPAPGAFTPREERTQMTATAAVNGECEQGTHFQLGGVDFCCPPGDDCDGGSAYALC